MEYVLHPRSEIDARIMRLEDKWGEMYRTMIVRIHGLGYFSGTAQEV